MEENIETEEQKNTKSEEALFKTKRLSCRKTRRKQSWRTKMNRDLTPEGEKSPAEENSDLRDRLLRSLAENENLIRRGRREREDAIKYAATNFARDMLSVSDNLSRALAALSGSDECQSGLN